MNRKFILSAIAGTLFISAQASAGVLSLNNWGFDPDGAGATAMVQPIDELTYLGLSYTDSDPTVAGNAGTIDNGDTFTDVGRLAATSFQNNGVPIPAGGPSGSGLTSTYNITAVFNDWTGTYSSASAFDFDPGGSFEMYVDTSFDEGALVNDASIQNYDNGLNILSAEIVKGSGTIDFGNTSGIDGNVDILFKVTAATAGYFYYDKDGDGTPETDLATLLGGPDPMYFGLTDSNNAIQILGPDDTVPGVDFESDGFGGAHDILDEFDDVTTFGPYTAGAPGLFDILTTNDGSYTPAIAEVSEPGMLSLMGLAFLGLAGLRRRKEED